MRKSKAIRLSFGLTVLVYEFTVADVVSLLDAVGNVTYTDDNLKKYFAKNEYDIYERGLKLIEFKRAGHWYLFSKKTLFRLFRERIFKAAIEVNSAWFEENKAAKTSNAKQKPIKASAIAKGLKNSVEVLIREGHSNPFGYGWAFFQNAVNFQQDLVNDNKKR